MHLEASDVFLCHLLSCVVLLAARLHMCCRCAVLSMSVGIVLQSKDTEAMHRPSAWTCCMVDSLLPIKVVWGDAMTLDVLYAIWCLCKAHCWSVVHAWQASACRYLCLHCICQSMESLKTHGDADACYHTVPKLCEVTHTILCQCLLPSFSLAGLAGIVHLKHQNTNSLPK